MRSIDRLREYVKDAPASSMGEMARAIVAGMTDEIERDERSHRGFAERLEAAASERADVTMFGVDYTPLPVDADGVPIHVGDVMEGYQLTIEVGGLSWDGESWSLVDVCGMRRHDCAAFTHHHAPTVEDVLREFYVYAERGKEHHREDVDDAVLAEYAARLRLAEGVDE